MIPAATRRRALAGHGNGRHYGSTTAPVVIVDRQRQAAAVLCSLRLRGETGSGPAARSGRHSSAVGAMPFGAWWLGGQGMGRTEDGSSNVTRFSFLLSLFVFSLLAYLWWWI